jgi:hypothetical protein
LLPGSSYPQAAPLSINAARSYALRIDWENPAGIRVMADSGQAFDRPDLVAVGSTVPEPATMALLGAGGLALLRRRRRR